MGLEGFYVSAGGEGECKGLYWKGWCRTSGLTDIIAQVRCKQAL